MTSIATDLQFILSRIESAERRAAELILHAHNILAETKTGARDVVTEFDRRVQELLIRLLGEAVPEAHFFCEEMNERDRLDAARLFIIDPIDGTMNFVRGFHHSCISVAYAECGVILAGAVYNPYVDEMFSAVKDCGALLNDRPIHVSEAGLADSVACFGTAPYSVSLSDRTFELARRVYDASLDVRREGSAALDLCTVAAGRAGLYFELQVSLWDYAAGALIAEEAGARCCRVSGDPLPVDGSKPDIVAGSPAAVSDFLELVKAP
jgi:myo-inositol-1(or 4)-monophosphatase